MIKQVFKRLGDYTMNNAIAYIRVSTKDQSENGFSLDMQKHEIQRYCEYHKLNLIEIICDAGISGKSIEARKGITKLVDQYITTKQVDHVITYTLARFARNTRETLELSDLMKDHNIEFHSVKEKIDTSTAQGRFFFTIMAAMNQLERETISERTKEVLQFKKANNERTGQIPFGFELDKDGIHLKQNRYEMNTVEMILQARNEGQSYRNIIKLLESKKRKNKRGVVKWNTNQIFNIYKAHNIQQQ